MMVLQLSPAWNRSAIVALSLLTVVGAAPAASAEATVQLTAPFTSEKSSSAETSIGDLVADALRRAASVQVAFVDAEALQEINLPKGPARASQFLTALSVPTDSVVVLTIKGDVLVAALERGVSNIPQPNPGFLQVSGLAYTLNTNARSGARTETIVVNSKALDKAASYTVAMPASLAQGANGYFLVWPARAPSRTLPVHVGEALSQYLAEEPTLTPSTPRIIR